jgi:hypothetical protein
MNKRKRSGKESAEQLPRDHPPKQVMEVARMLYALKPFEITGEMSWWDWKALVLRANIFLDNLRSHCEREAQQRREWFDDMRRMEKEIADEATLKERESYTEGVKFITREKKRGKEGIDRAEKKGR